MVPVNASDVTVACLVCCLRTFPFRLEFDRQCNSYNVGEAFGRQGTLYILCRNESQRWQTLHVSSHAGVSAKAHPAYGIVNLFCAVQKNTLVGERSFPHLEPPQICARVGICATVSGIYAIEVWPSRSRNARSRSLRGLKPMLSKDRKDHYEQLRAP
jgi:hypothetical protein